MMRARSAASAAMACRALDAAFMLSTARHARYADMRCLLRCVYVDDYRLPCLPLRALRALRAERVVRDHDVYAR